jgi:hypothetical protein
MQSGAANRHRFLEFTRIIVSQHGGNGSLALQHYCAGTRKTGLGAVAVFAATDSVDNIGD